MDKLEILFFYLTNRFVDSLKNQINIGLLLEFAQF